MLIAKQAPQEQSVATAGRRPSWLPLLAGLAVLLGASYGGFTQEPRLDAFATAPSVASLDWWTQPIEVNPTARLAAFTGTINDIALKPGTNELWIVGNGGVVARSTDDGGSWERIALKEAPPGSGTPQPTATPQKKASLDDQFGFIGRARAETQAARGIPPPGVTQRPQATPAAAQPPPPAQQVAPQTAAPQPKQQQQLPLQQQQQQEQPKEQVPASIGPSENFPVWAMDQAEHARLSGIAFENGSHGVIIGERGLVLETLDGGNSWAIRPFPAQLHVDDIAYSGLGLLKLGQNFFLSDIDVAVINAFALTGGVRIRTNARMSSSTSTAFYQSADGKFSWTAHLSGRVTTSTKDLKGDVVQQTTSPSKKALYALTVAEDHLRAWTAGEDSTIYRTTDGGKTWNPTERNGTGAIHQILMTPDGSRGWAVGARGTILGTRDGGARWVPLARQGAASVSDTGTDFKTAGLYLRLPAPWYYVSLFVAAGFLVPAFRPVRKPEPGEAEAKTGALDTASIADLFASDRPVETKDADRLGFTELALGISRFLRNEKTEPPLTLAINGEWGTGKSSLMNLIVADLRRFRFRPVWFNAWHHQKEDHMLAALLAAVRAGAVAPWWSLQGLRYRGRLLAHRLQEQPARLIVLAALLALPLGVWMVPHAWESMTGLLSKLGASEDGGSNLLKTLLVGVPFAPSVVGLVYLLYNLSDRLKQFGLDPAKLMAGESGGTKVRDLSNRLSFRTRFAAEFDTVTRALAPRTTVIVIDDLDRCRPKSVIEVMEAVNFLISSGACYVIFGMARERVERCIGLAFKDVAEQLFEPDTDPRGPEARDSKERLARFARQYLEKLVNIEVAVPPMTPGDGVKLLEMDTRAGSTRLSRWQWVGKAFDRLRPSLALVFTGALVLALTFGLGHFVGEWLVGTPASEAGMKTPGMSTPESGGAGAAAAQPNLEPNVGELYPGEQAPTPLWGEGVVLVASATLLCLWVLQARESEAPWTSDSPEFERALGIWEPVTVLRQRTPRALKRFVNRVRYLAMLEREPQPAVSLTERLLALLRGVPMPTQQWTRRKGAIRESTLVAIAALGQYDRALLDSTLLSQAFATVSGQIAPAPVLDALQQGARLHAATFPSTWPPSTDDLRRFDELSRGVVVS